MTNTLAKGILIAWESKLYDIQRPKSFTDQGLKNLETSKIMFAVLANFVDDEGMKDIISSLTEVIKRVDNETGDKFLDRLNPGKL